MSRTKTSWIFDVTEAAFEKEVLQRSLQTPVVVDFWAPWCGPCRMLGPLLEQLIEERNGEVLLAKVNVDQEQQLAALFQISSIPAVIAFKGGRAVLDFAGALPESQLRLFLDEIAPRPSEKLMARAAQLEKADPVQAEALYRQALQEDPRQEEAQVGLARVLLERHQDEEAQRILDNLAVTGPLAMEVERLQAILALRRLNPAGTDEKTLRQQMAQEPKKAQPRYQLGCWLAAQGQYQEALEMLISAGERDASLASSKVREAMVRIFHVVGNTSPLATEYRERLTSLLY